MLLPYPLSAVILSVVPEGAANLVAEGNETNNVNQGVGIDKDDVTYFPWDNDGDGNVFPSDAIYVINRLTQTVPPADARADLDGNGRLR